MLLQKKIFTLIQTKKFRRFDDIEFSKNEKTLYLLEYEPKKER